MFFFFYHLSSFLFFDILTGKGRKNMTMIKKKTEVIPCIYERSFAYIYDQNQEFLSKLLSTILGIEYTSILGHITKISNNTKLEYKTDKKRQMDFVYRIDNLSIDIELNLRSKATKERNMFQTLECM